MSLLPVVLSSCAATSSTMSTRKLGTLEVSALGAGAMSISANYGPPADKNLGIAPVRGRVETIHAQAEKAAQAVVETTASGKVLDGLAAQLKASLGQFRA